MLYPIVIHQQGDSAYGVTIPDIPGCFSAGDTLEEAMVNTREAIEGHLAILAEDGEAIPSATDKAKYIGNVDFAGGFWAEVEVDVTPFFGKAENSTSRQPIYSKAP